MPKRKYYYIKKLRTLKKQLSPSSSSSSLLSDQNKVSTNNEKRLSENIGVSENEIEFASTSEVRKSMNYTLTLNKQRKHNLLSHSPVTSSSDELYRDETDVDLSNTALEKLNSTIILSENTEVYENDIKFASTSESEFRNNMNDTLTHNKQRISNLLSHSEVTSSSDELYRDEADVKLNNTALKELNSNITFKQKMRDWSMKYISCLTNKMLSDLLCILKTEHTEFPTTAKTFLLTAKSRNVVRPMLSNNGSFGTYIYFGLETIFRLIINPEIYVEDTIQIVVNIDGVQIYKNSKQQFWPILIMVHNEKYIVKPQVVALYHGSSKPKSPTEFLDEFITELSTLMINNITLADKTYSVKVVGFVCDTPARAFIKCVKSHVAFYACERCTVKGQTVGKNKRIYAKTTCEERTKESFEMRSQPEHHLDGISPLLKIPGFDPIKSVFLDSMHLLFLGVTKTLLNHILFGGSKGGGIGPRNRFLLSNLLLDLSGQIPAEFQRKVLDINDLNNWKATQFRFFLLYSSALVLRYVLPTRKYRHFCLLYVACRLLSHNSLAVSNAGTAKTMLILFFRLLPKFYGSDIQSINFHNLIHLSDDVTHMGCSLTSFSAFPFENFLMTLKHLVRTPNKPLSQVANRLREITLNTDLKVHQIVPLTDIVEDKSQLNLDDHITRKTFTSVTWNRMMITKTSPNNVVQLKNGEFIEIDTIFSSHNVLNTEKIILEGTLYRDTIDVFTYPYKSSDVGLWCVTLSKYRRTFQVREIKHKCIRIKLENSIYCLQLLHT